jgi:hypothetical protein
MRQASHFNTMWPTMVELHYSCSMLHEHHQQASACIQPARPAKTPPLHKRSLTTIHPPAWTAATLLHAQTHHTAYNHALVTPCASKVTIQPHLAHSTATPSPRNVPVPQSRQQRLGCQQSLGRLGSCSAACNMSVAAAMRPMNAPDACAAGTLSAQELLRFVLRSSNRG